MFAGEIWGWTGLFPMSLSGEWGEFAMPDVACIDRKVRWRSFLHVVGRLHPTRDK